MVSNLDPTSAALGSPYTYLSYTGKGSRSGTRPEDTESRNDMANHVDRMLEVD